MGRGSELRRDIPLGDAGHRRADSARRGCGRERRTEENPRYRRRLAFDQHRLGFRGVRGREHRQPVRRYAAVAFVVVSIGASLGGPTGYAINPARDLGPRIVYAILPIKGKGSAEWNYSWVPVVGPLVGGLLAGLLFQILPASS